MKPRRRACPSSTESILAWSSDVYHHDGDDAWRALEMMRECNLQESHQTKFLGENARKLYHIDTPKTFIRERVTEIERPDWWPSEAEIQRALEPEASLVQPYGESGQRVNGHAAEGDRV